MFKVVTVDRLKNMRTEHVGAFTWSLTSHLASAIKGELKVFVYDDKDRLVAAVDFIDGLQYATVDVTKATGFRG